MFKVSDDTQASVANETTQKSDGVTATVSESFSNMVTSYMEEQTRKITALNKSLELQQESVRSSYQEMSINVQSRIKEYFSSLTNFNSSFSMLESWFSKESGAQNSLIDYLFDLTEKDTESAAGAVGELFGVQAEIQSILSNISNSSYGSNNTIYSSIKSINMEVNEFGANNIFSSLSLDVKMSKIEMYGQDTVDDCDLLENGGDMIEFEGTYINVSIFAQIMDPIVLDLGGNGLDLKPLKDGVVFDLKGDGSEVRTGFVQGDDALLFFDANGDGQCSDGKELFGDQEGDLNGFSKLAKYDSNQDGVINAADEIYKDLKVWNDLNGDGKSQENEIRTLSEAGVEELGLAYEDVFTENAGNYITEQGTFRRSDGVLGEMVDVQFRYIQNNILDY